MANSYQRATSDGTMVLLDISIDYLDRDEIKVYFDDVLTTSGWSWSGTSDKRILFSPVVPNGVVVMVKRTTDASELRHYFSRGAQFTAPNLDEDLRQALHMAQEASEANLVGDFFTDINMHGFRVYNLGTAVDNTDALTLGQYKADADGAYQAKLAAQAAQAAAEAAAGAAVNLRADLLNTTDPTKGLALLGFRQFGTGAVARTMQPKTREIRKSIEDFGGSANGVLDNTAALALVVAASGGRFHLPGPGTYVMPASIWGYAFTSGDDVQIKVGATTYPASNCIAGPWRYTVDSPVLMSLRHAVSGNTLQQWQDGSGGTATYFYRGLAFTTDSHWCQVQPATLNGSTDLLWQRSKLHADAAGNRFNQTFEEGNDRMLWSFATSASGAPAFDTAIALTGGPTAALSFPALPLNIHQGWRVRTRTLGALNFGLEPTSATRGAYKDYTSNNVLATVTRSEQRLAGLGFDTLLDVPSGVVGPKRWGAVFGDLTSADATFPVTKTLMDTAGATRNSLIGTLRVAACASSALGGWRESRFTFDGTTLTVTDVVNTLDPAFTVTIIKSGTTLQLSGSYTGNLGGGYTVSVSVEFQFAGR